MPKRSPESGLPDLGAPDQIGVLVPELRAAHPWRALVAREAWAVYRYGPHNLSALSYRGAPGRFSMRIALSPTIPEIELIEPLEGPSIYHEWIAEHGYGVHHLGYIVDSIAELAPELERRGFALIQSGSGFGLDGDGGFAYFDTLEALGTIVELIELPAREPPTEEVPSGGTT